MGFIDLHMYNSEAVSKPTINFVIQIVALFIFKNLGINKTFMVLLETKIYQNVFYSDYGVGVKVEAVVRLTRSGSVESTILSKMTSDVEDKFVQELIDNHGQMEYTFNPGLDFHDPVEGNTSC